MRFGKVHREQSKRTRTKLEFFPSPPGAPFLLPFFQVCLLCSSQVARTTPDLALWGSGRSWTFNLSNFVNSLLLLHLRPTQTSAKEKQVFFRVKDAEKCRIFRLVARHVKSLRGRWTTWLEAVGGGEGGLVPGRVHRWWLGGRPVAEREGLRREGGRSALS